MQDDNLYQRGGTWYARIQVNGRDIRRSLHTDNVRVARERLKALVKEADERRAGVVRLDPFVWEQAVARWHDTKFGSLRPATRIRYGYSLKALAPHFVGRQLGIITRALVSDYVAARQRTGVSAATVRRDLNVLSMVLEEAIEAEMLPDAFANPVTKIRRRLVERREPIQPVRLRSIAKMVRVATPGFAGMIRFLARTGCRQEEAASLEWSQLDLKRGTCTFVKTKTRSPRVIKLSGQVLRDIRRLPRSPDRDGGAFVFRASHGGRYGDPKSRFRELRDRLPPPLRGFRCHDLRHTFAIHWLQAGGGLYDLARHLGHSTVQTTEMYAGWLVNRPR